MYPSFPLINKVNRVFSLVQKSQNTVQLYNQLKYLQPYKGKNLFLVKGIKKATEEILSYSKANILSKSLYNWVICICSTPDLSTFKEKYRDFWK